MRTKSSKLLQIVLALFVVACVAFSAKTLIVDRIKADDSDTSVDVGSTAPSFTVAPAESAASDATTPTNAGTTITFSATASDANNDDYWLAICKTNAATASISGPTCTGGNWCISDDTGSGEATDCEYVTQTGDLESNAWYAFVCDMSSCSSSSQGSGSSGSPFKVNHAPAVDDIQVHDVPTLDNPVLSFDPGDTVYFAVTASDDDTDTASDTVKLFVCSTNSATSAGCAATTFCSATLTGSNPTCSYEIDDVIASQFINYYVFVYDNHNLEATYNVSNANSYFINNVTPTVSSVTLNGGSDITLTESSNTSVTMTATVTDANSCQDVNISDVTAYLYRSGVGFSSCDEGGESNSNRCYAAVTCTVSGNTCTGATDDSISVTCSTDVRYYADPTTTNTQYPGENWIATLRAEDSGDNVHTANATAVEMNALIALNATAAINYGSLAAGANTGATNQSVVVQSTGNTGIDTETSGTDMTFSTYTIPVGNQEYSTSAFTYGSGTDLSSSATEVELNVQKTTTETPAQKTLYWGIGLPAIVGAGTYTGTNTLTAVLGETANW